MLADLPCHVFWYVCHYGVGTVQRKGRSFETCLEALQDVDALAAARACSAKEPRWRAGDLSPQRALAPHDQAPSSPASTSSDATTVCLDGMKSCGAEALIIKVYVGSFSHLCATVVDCQTKRGHHIMIGLASCARLLMWLVGVDAGICSGLCLLGSSTE